MDVLAGSIKKLIVKKPCKILHLGAFASVPLAGTAGTSFVTGSDVRLHASAWGVGNSTILHVFSDSP